jgi:ABC-type sugar transport system permease subunit
MGDVAGDPAVLEQLRIQRSRLADRMRPPWWYLTGAAVLWAVVFASPFSSRYLPRGMPTWPVMVAAVAVACLLQWGLTRATGLAIGIPDLTYRPGRPARIAMLVVSLAALGAEHFLVGRGLAVAAIVVAALAVGAAVVSVQAALRGIRRDLRAGGGAA